MSGTKAQQAREMMAGVCPARAEQRKPPGATSAAAGRSLTSALLGVPSTAGSQRRRPNARWAAVGEASEASRDADVTVANAHAQRHGCLSARWAQTCAPRAEGHDARHNRRDESEKPSNNLKQTPGTWHFPLFFFAPRTQPGPVQGSPNIIQISASELGKGRGREEEGKEGGPYWLLARRLQSPLKQVSVSCTPFFAHTQ